jgi:hypothetical protein
MPVCGTSSFCWRCLLRAKAGDRRALLDIRNHASVHETDAYRSGVKTPCCPPRIPCSSKKIP